MGTLGVSRGMRRRRRRRRRSALWEPVDVHLLRRRNENKADFLILF